MNNKVKYLDHNLLGYDYIIGDLHGCYELFLRGLDKIEFDKSKDRIISVGDLIDRGPQSWECLQLMHEPWFECVRGNHEDMMYEEIVKETYGNWEYNGGGWVRSAIDTYGKSSVVSEAKYIGELPYIIVIGKDSENRINVVHAEIHLSNSQKWATDEDIDTWNFDDRHIDGLFWGRNIIKLENVFKDSINSGLSPTFVGHTPQKVFKSFKSHNYIDSGAVYGGDLTFVRVRDQKRIIIKPKKSEIRKGLYEF